jgi:hypothetical protein
MRPNRAAERRDRFFTKPAYEACGPKDKQPSNRVPGDDRDAGR